MNFEFHPSVFILSVESWDKKISFRGGKYYHLSYSVKHYTFENMKYFISRLLIILICCYMLLLKKIIHTAAYRKLNLTRPYMGTTVTACVICFLQCLVTACVIYFLPCLLVSYKHQICRPCLQCIVNVTSQSERCMNI